MADTDVQTSRIKQPASNNVYTALLFIAVIALGAACAVVWKTSVDLTKSLQPAGALPSPFYRATPEAIEKGV